MTKICTKCKIEKEYSFFYKQNSKKDGYKSHCKECILKDRQRYYNTEKGYKSKIEKSWKDNGMIFTVEEYNILLNKQGGKCAICSAVSNNDGTKLCVDHCHTTGKIRGLLCHKCNTSLGKFNDDINLLEQAINYLIKYRKELNEINK